jgi:hypothetical protein
MSETPPPPPGSDPTQPPPAQPPPAQPPMPPYGAPQYIPAYGPVAPDHPQSTTVLILGILGLLVCGVIAPFAWVMGNRVVAEIDASNGAIGGRGNAQAGRICGIVGSVLLGTSLLFVVGLVVLALGASVSST